MCARTCFFWCSSLSCVSTSSFRRSETLMVLHLAAACASCAERITLQGRGRSLALDVVCRLPLLSTRTPGLQVPVQGSLLGEQRRARRAAGSGSSRRTPEAHLT